ncbi:MAG TPA: NAD-dependent epimerase/dehydratase family protein [Candidatus Nanoarchaeia archaeon]|nr:NAD-dependent epimerase/dehydratase family protein [Candidatus Nanoarchaeia archaeon]
MKKKVVVVGGAGFIGSNLVRALVAKKYDVHVVDNLSAGKKEAVDPKAKLHKVDMRNFKKLLPIFRGATYVFHLAAMPRVQVSIQNPQETHDINVNGTLNVFIAASQAKVKKVIYSASSSAYGDQETFPLHEGLPANPKSPYGLQKYIGEMMLRVWSQVYGLPGVSLRYFNVYGPGQSEKGEYALVIGKFLRQKREGVPLSITGDGEQTRDFTSVHDVVRANILAAETKEATGGDVINIGAGDNRTINSIAQMIGGPTKHVAARLEPRHNKADNRKAFQILGWKPEVKLEDGIRELVELEEKAKTQVKKARKK